MKTNNSMFANANIKLIMIILSILSLLLVAIFSVWILVSPPPKQESQVQGASTTDQEALIRQLQKDVFGDQ